MFIESIEIEKATIVRASSDVYFKKDTLFVLDRDKKIYLKVVEIHITEDSIYYGLQDISYYNPIKNLSEPRGILQEELRLADDEEIIIAKKQSQYIW